MQSNPSTFGDGCIPSFANLALSLLAVRSQKELYHGLPPREKAYLVTKVTSLGCSILIKDAVPYHRRLYLSLLHEDSRITPSYYNSQMALLCPKEMY